MDILVTILIWLLIMALIAVWADSGASPRSAADEVWRSSGDTRQEIVQRGIEFRQALRQTLDEE